MDISSGSSYPASSLSNFSPHPFIIDGVECSSMEGFLQSLKFKDENMQKEICKKVGRQAKKAGAKKNKLYIGKERNIKEIQLNTKNY